MNRICSFSYSIRG